MVTMWFTQVSGKRPVKLPQTVLQESAEVVVLNNLSGAHLELFPETAKKIRELGLNPFIIGTGVIPPEDQEELFEKRSRRCFLDLALLLRP